MLNAIKPSDDLQVNDEITGWTYRAAIGIVNNGKAGQKESAKAAFTKFLTAAKGSKRNLDDDKARLKVLKN